MNFIQDNDKKIHVSLEKTIMAVKSRNLCTDSNVMITKDVSMTSLKCNTHNEHLQSIQLEYKKI